MRPVFHAALLLGCLAVPAAADPALLTVTGQGSVAARPDEARINGNADAHGASVVEALAAQKLVMSHIAAALAKLGTLDKDFTITAINVNPQYAAGPVTPGQVRTPTGYNANTQFSVIAEHPERLADILQALSDAGLNASSRVSFMVHDPAALAQARAAAVKDAFARAQVLAQQTGVTLGPVAAVTDGPRPLAALNYVEQLMSAINPLVGGTQTVAATVTVSWAIKQ